jgi:hypothetical protein
MKGKNSVTAEQKAEEILATADHLQRAEADAGLDERILAAVRTCRPLYILRPAQRWAIAASVILIAGINVFSITRFNRDIRQQESAIFYNEYFSFLNQQ